ncbi:hypothetical protein NQ317_005570, partial [Molorchus minor]
KHEYSDFRPFYVAIGICTVIGISIFVLNIVLGCCSRHSRYWNDRHTVLNVIIGKQFFPRYYRLQVNPATPRERRVQAHLELAELVEILARLLVMRKSDTQLAFCCLGIGIERSSNRWIVSLWTATPHQQPPLDYTELENVHISPQQQHTNYPPPSAPIHYTELQKKRE